MENLHGLTFGIHNIYKDIASQIHSYSFTCSFIPDLETIHGDGDRAFWPEQHFRLVKVVNPDSPTAPFCWSSRLRLTLILCSAPQTFRVRVRSYLYSCHVNKLRTTPIKHRSCCCWHSVNIRTIASQISPIYSYPPRQFAQLS